MHSSLVRVQNAFGFFTTVAFVVAALIASTDFLAPRTPSGTIKATDVSVILGRAHSYSSKKEEFTSIKFNLNADLSSLFTWNTKQIFVYVTAEWPVGLAADGKSNVTDSAVIWDRIITNPSADHLLNVGPTTLKKLRRSAAGKSVDPSRGNITLKNQRPKYQITHPTGRLAETENLRLRLHYNVQPWVGFLTWDMGSDLGLWKRMKNGVSARFSLPEVKKKKVGNKTP